MQAFAGRFCSVPGAKCWPAGWSSSCSARKASRRSTTRPVASRTTVIESRNGMVRRRQVGQITEPADERLRVAHADADVDLSGERRLREPPARLRQLRDGRAAPPPPPRRRGRVEADLPDLGRMPIDVRVQLAAASERVDHERLAARREEELGQVHVPEALGRPPDRLTRLDDVTGADGGLYVPVAEVADAGQPDPAGSRRLAHAPALDREHAVRPARRRAPLTPVVADGDVDSGVVDRAAPRVRARIEEGAPDRMLALERQHRPAAPRVVVGLEGFELPRDGHGGTIAGRVGKDAACESRSSAQESRASSSRTS